eukprot:jgi/Tetstr1/434745/TSEL_023797.t1
MRDPVVHVLANLTSRPPMFMTEPRKRWLILDSNDISIRARYTKTMANIWADRLSREIDYVDLAFNLRHFNHLGNILGPRHTIDRFATMENARLLRYNSRWRVTLAARPPAACASPIWLMAS